MDQHHEPAEHHCVICLNPCEDRAVLENCQHEFCFRCILQWSMISHSCPLCVQIFESCLHQIEDDRHFKVHTFDPLPSHSSKKGSSSSSDMVVPHGIIRQIYGPPQRRRRFETSRLLPEESAAERTIVEQQELRLERRREVYRHKLFVKHMGANKISGFQQITPETFKIFPQLIERLVPWIRRELQAILSLSLPASSTSSSSRSGQGQHPPQEDPNPTSSSELMTGLELIREYITAVLKRYDLQTDQAQDLLRDFLHEHTEHFVHELMAFARSPFSMEAYDQAAQYDSPSPQPRHDGPSRGRPEYHPNRRDRREDRSESSSRGHRRKRGRSQSTSRSRSRTRSRRNSKSRVRLDRQSRSRSRSRSIGQGAERYQRRSRSQSKNRSRTRIDSRYRASSSNRHGKLKAQAPDTLINRPQQGEASEDQILFLNRGDRASSSAKDASTGPSTSISTVEHGSDKDGTAANRNNALHMLLQAKLEREKALYLSRQG
ncbi:MAG: hypothetical protein BYD32DRAFT_255636 [Podila humilis]|nr:MAG: hypothetical protein BYD32DRAFT_255636 [Podila humilis]